MVALNKTAFLTIDTTGLPGNIPGWRPCVVGLGLALVEGDKVLHATGGLISQDADHVTDPRARGAWHANGIDPRDVLDTTITEAEVARSVQDAVKGCTLRGYNTEFLRKFLEAPPYNLQGWGACVMKEASQVVEGKGRAKYPALNAALYWATTRGHDIQPPDGVRNRAHQNAVRIAKLAIALTKERGE